jgi:DNA-directed RNA polymerase specialized sigma24 family protein
MDVESDWQNTEQRMAMLEAICEYADKYLHEPHRTIFQLRFEEGLKLKDIASRQGMNLKTVFKYLSQSIDEIHKHFTI